MEHLNGIQAYVAQLQEQIETHEATIQKLRGRLDESNLNFKYETLLESYNDAEREIKALKASFALDEAGHQQIVLLQTENVALKEKLSGERAQYDQLRAKYTGLKEQLSELNERHRAADQQHRATDPHRATDRPDTRLSRRQPAQVTLLFPAKQ